MQGNAALSRAPGRGRGHCERQGAIKREMKGPWLVELAAKFRAGVKVTPRPESASPAGCYLPRLTWKTGSFWKGNPLCVMFRGAFPSRAALLWEGAAFSLQPAPAHSWDSGSLPNHCKPIHGRWLAGRETGSTGHWCAEHERKRAGSRLRLCELGASTGGFPLPQEPGCGTGTNAADLCVWSLLSAVSLR